MSLQETSNKRMFGGEVRFYSHDSRVCNAPMRFSVFVPPQAASSAVPVLYWLSGLTCTEENFTIKAGAQKCAAELGLMIVAPDTSPRNLGIEGEDERWDLGSGAAFYVNATREPWSSHYRMFDYVVEELPELIEHSLPAKKGARAISGHSMGGHGALVIGIRHPERFSSVSAFAPICAPSQCPWGERAFGAYLGPDRKAWADYDTVALLEARKSGPSMLVDQGEADGFLKEQLKPELLQEVADRHGIDLQLRMRPGYDHSYFFVATFMDEHLGFHARNLAR